MVTYSPELVDEICERIAKGEPLRQICRDKHMPSWQAVYQWIADDKDEEKQEFARRIAYARELGHDAIAEECLDIADDGSNDWMKKEHDSGRITEVLDSEHVQRSKLRIETRLKLLAKWNPKKYGDKLDLTHRGQIATGITADDVEILAAYAGKDAKAD